MPRQTVIVSVFLASPSDVHVERSIVDRVITQWNAIRGRDRNLMFEVLRWETSTSSAIGIDGQDVVNYQIGDDYDAMIALFWTKIGAVTSRAASGSVEEYERALNRHKAGEPIQIGVYFKTSAPSLHLLNPSQYQSVLDLKEALKKDGVYYKEFEDDQSLDFEINVLLDRLARVYSPQGSATFCDTDANPDAQVAPSSEYSEKDSSEDLGYYDLLESIENHSDAASAFLNGASEQLEHITNVSNSSSQRITELKAFGPAQPSDVKPIIAEVTDSLDQFSIYIENGIDDYSTHNSGIAEDTRNLIDVAQDFDVNSRDVDNTREMFLRYIESSTEAIESMESLVDSIRSLQRMTVRFNQARKRLVNNIEKLIDLIKSSRTLMMEALDALPKA
jgi:hypothetical protein